MSESGREVSWMSGSGREALPDVQEWSGGPNGCSGVVGRPSRLVGMPFRMSGSGREALLNVQEWSKALSDVQLWSGVPTGIRGVVGRPTGKSGCEREVLPDDRE